MIASVRNSEYIRVNFRFVQNIKIECNGYNACSIKISLRMDTKYGGQN